MAILPSQGFPPDYAGWLKRYAVKKGWKEFKIVQTQDEWKQLGVVCKPKHWITLMRESRNNGTDFPPNAEDKFMGYCLKVMTEEEGFVEKKPELTKDEDEILKVLVDKAMNVEIDPQELEQDLWQKEEKKAKPDKLITNEN